ncbi:competence type IV pilus ATPase ComGA [Staphylococcus sp. NRL 16/872]|uniref:competence type IV pilus ATPase ComGA n=1 Tax=Staphylococcus sp. NRL 16/872 TaxID=2930131 RepID=UPI001FB39135|nr:MULTISPECIES: competence type IV pilus ATPase ComGA [unclassified Staphylococcus]MCJ1656277.1 Flp pilus assembly complex ATPase component TadA [Staphylococcus sp. NRL 21/187]MCJ1668097.1 Flp pilus assembly complex ATPase component TadA [Staphylococcus sp. NRL 19/737]WEN68298.1 competence type IV pilus ATPase ComGA [Staphylococcus sp. NRL 16/872]
MKLLFKEIVNKAISKNASDIHFIPAEDEVYIKFRVNDNLELYDTFKLDIYQKLLVYMKFQAGLDVSTQQLAQSGRYTYQAKSLYYLRISTLPLSLGTESCVIRIIPQYFQSKKEYKDFKDFKHLMNKKQGLILFTGPTGSGKSTLMYQMVLYAYEKLNLNVITIENPVEQLLKGITQVSINKKAGIDYINSFKAILRCDPDVILIGEIRDAEVAKCVIQASLSGHLVLSTMHSSNCKGALLRLLEMGISIQEISQAVNLISNQRLITTLSNQRQLVCELINNNQIQYFFEHNNTLPKNFNNLKDKLLMLSKEGTICEEIADKYL